MSEIDKENIKPEANFTKPDEPIAKKQLSFNDKMSVHSEDNHNATTESNRMTDSSLQKSKIEEEEKHNNLDQDHDQNQDLQETPLSQLNHDQNLETQTVDATNCNEEVPIPFIEGWHFIATLGEGAFGLVKLAMNDIDNSQKVAVKIIDMKVHRNASAQTDKEINIHKRLDHEHVIKYYGEREDNHIRYIFLEYAAGQELYDMIEPNKGMETNLVRKLFKQLMNACQYIHTKGFCHRDIKPENIIITNDNVLKLIDFGMATYFRHRGVERKLNKRCGTPQYLAPEVLLGVYHYAIPAEMWSCGIVLVAMLCGELPWAEASSESSDWNLWLDKNPELESKTPWTKIDLDTLAFIRKILHHKPSKRYNIEQILEHRWMTNERKKLKVKRVTNLSEISKKLQDSRLAENKAGNNNNNSNGLLVSKQIKRKLDEIKDEKDNQFGLTTSSQIVDPYDLKRRRMARNNNFSSKNSSRGSTDLSALSDFDNNKLISSTQPTTTAIQNLYITASQVPIGFSQIGKSQNSNTQNYQQNLSKAYHNLFSMKSTNFKIDLKKFHSLYHRNSSLEKELTNIFEGLNLMVLSTDQSGSCFVLSPSRAKDRLNNLKFTVRIMRIPENYGKQSFDILKEAEEKMIGLEKKEEEKDAKSIDVSTEQIRLINFRLNKGDGMDFKRHFLSIKEALKKMIVRI